MSRPADFRERCPVCRARLGDELECRRCGLDFSPILEAADRAEELAEQVRLKLKAGLSEEAFWEALRASRIHVSKETLRSLALAALAQHRFELALALWRKIKES